MTTSLKQTAKNKNNATLKLAAALSFMLLVAGVAVFLARTGSGEFKNWDAWDASNARMPYSLMLAGFAGLVATVALFFRLPSYKHASVPLVHDIKRDKYLYMLILPGILAVFIFSYMPMYGVILAFKEYKTKSGILFSEWIGLVNFTRFFGRSVAKSVIGNTLFIGVTQLLITFPVPIILALLLNELRSVKFRRVMQSIIYLPHFISWIIVYTLLFSLFSVTSGMISKALISIGLQPLTVLTNPKGFYALLYTTSIWKEAGWGTIIYMAAIIGVDQEMYEAAFLDGANRFQQCVHITLPAIAFALTTMFILNIGSLMGSNFDQIMNLRTAATSTTVAQVIDTYVYDMGVEKAQYDLSTAIGLFQQVINCVLLFASNKVVQRLTGEGFF